MKIDLETAASLDRDSIILAAARLMEVAAHDNSIVRLDILKEIDRSGHLEAWKKSISAYPSES